MKVKSKYSFFVIALLVIAPLYIYAAADESSLYPENLCWIWYPEDFLVSAAHTKADGFSLYLMDIHGNRELLYTGESNSWYAQPLRPRTPPEPMPDRVVWPEAGEEPQKGTLISQNVYAGLKACHPARQSFCV